MGELFDTILLEPVLNGLMMLSNWFGGSFGWAIIVMTIVINLVLLPLTLRQTRSMVAMQEKQRAMAPKMQELQKKYAKDKQKLQQETFKLYKEHGFTPMGCLSPMLLLLVQMPIWLAIYQSIMHALAETPENLVGLSNKLYSWPVVQEAVPPDGHFLGINLSQPNFFLVLLVGLTMWLTQKVSSTPSTDPKQQQMQQMMQMMFPLMMVVIFINFPSGLPLYILIANLIRMVVQSMVTGKWGGLERLFRRGAPVLAPAGGPSPLSGDAPDDKAAKEMKPPAGKDKSTGEKGKGTGDGSSRSKRKNRRRSR